MFVTDYIFKLIALNRTEKALESLEPLIREYQPDKQEELVLISNQWHQLQQDAVKGHLSAAEARQFRTRTNSAILELAQLLPHDIKLPVSRMEVVRLDAAYWLKRWYVWLILMMWAVIAALGLLLMIQSRTDVKVKMNIRTNRVAFTTQESRPLYINRRFPTVQLFNFISVELPVESLQITDGSDYTYSSTELPPFQLTPTKEDIPSATFYEAELQQLQLLAGGRIIIQVADELEGVVPTIGLDFQPGSISGTLVSQDSLLIETQYATLRKNATSGSDPAVLQARFDNNLKQIEFKGSEDNFFINIEATGEGAYTLKEQNMEVSRLDFNRPDGSGRVKSGIQTATLSLLDKQGVAYRDIELDPLEYLSVIGRGTMRLVSIQLSAQDIQLQLVGEATQLSRGHDLAELAPIHPSQLHWLWYNAPWWLLGPLLLAVLLSLVLHVLFRRRLYYT